MLQSFFIVVTQGARNGSEVLDEMFEIQMQLGLVDVNILIKDEATSVWALYYYKPYAVNCHSFEKFQIDTFTTHNYTKYLNVSFSGLYPERNMKFHNCAMYVASFSFEPYVIIRNSTNGTTTFSGVDVEIVNEISKALNLIPIYMQTPDRKRHGQVYPNGTADGAVKMILDGVANMTLGGFALTPQRAQAMASSFSYMKTAFVFAFIRILIPSPPLWKLMAPFQYYVWISIAVLLTISIAIILLSRKLTTRQRHFIIGGHMNRTPIMNMLNVLIGSVIPNPKMACKQYFGVFARTLALLWIFFWLIVRNSYQGSLFQFLQDQRGTNPYDTVSKVRDSNVQINMATTLVNLIPEDFDESRYIVYENTNQYCYFVANSSQRDHYFRFVMHSKDDVTAIKSLLARKWDGILFTNDLTINYFNMIKKTWYQLGYTLDVVRPHTPVFLFPKHSILTWLFNRKVEACNESGLISHWAAKYNPKRLKIESKKPKKLAINNILAMLQISFVMYSIAVSVFVLEIMSRSHNRIKRFLDFLTY